MTSLKKRPLSGWDALLAFSILAILVAGWILLFPPKSARAQTIKPGVTLAQVEAETTRISGEAALEGAKVTARTWELSAEELGSVVLSRLTQLAKERGLQVSDFRSGRVISASNLWEVSFTAVLEGSFPEVVKAVESLENPLSKIAVSQFKITAKGDSDQVSAVLGLTGFIVKEGK